jgi:hypothetical protein
MNNFRLLLSTIVLLMTMNACNKSTTNYPMNVKMTDGPGPYSAVNIDLQQVEVITNDSAKILINVKAGIYNLLDLTNGLDTLIATASMTNPNISQIRLILGANNTVVLNGVTYPLSTPSADQSGLKVQVRQTLLAGVENVVLIDFDADKSIVETGNNTFKLKPVIRTVEVNITGSIKGNITPVGSLAIVTAVSSAGLSYSSYVSKFNGEFKLSGIPPGVYTVTITPTLPLAPVIKTNVVVTTGVSTSVGTIIL